MPKSVTEHFKVDEAAFQATGALDALLDMDSLLFIDPHLLAAAKTPELAGSRQSFLKRFSDLLHVLASSQGEGDRFWRQAEKLLTFPEVQGLCIGYGAQGTAGSGMGRGLRQQLLKTAKEITAVGINDPAIFELVGLFEEDIGPDRVSDMTARVIAPHLMSFTQRVARDLSIPSSQTLVGEVSYAVPTNPFNGQPLILVPEEILRPLPIAYSWSDIDLVCAHNEALRNRVNKDIGDTWKQATGDKVTKATLRRTLLNNPGALKDLLDQYKIKPSATYSFRDDPDVVLSWKKAVSDLAHDSPLHLSLPSEPTLADVIEVVRAILTQFKKAIESQRWATFLYKSNGLPQKEGVSQLLFYGIADSYCAANNLDISPEADAGRGPVDFKFSRGYSIRVVVEVKLSSNKQLVHGFTTQTPEYQEAERAGHAFLLVVDVSRSNAWRRRLLKAEANLKLAGNKTPEIVFIDGHVKATASRYHPR